MDALDGRAGSDPEIVAEQDAHAIVGEQRLCGVAPPLERFDQEIW
jgi:hypothetical protein